jgi:hypothetical protein
MTESNFLQSKIGKFLFPILSMVESEVKKDEQIQKFRYISPANAPGGLAIILFLISLTVPIYAIYLAMKESSGKESHIRIANIVAAIFLGPLYILYIWYK